MEMVWRFRRCFLHKGPNHVIRALHTSPICHVSCPRACPTNKTQESFLEKLGPETSKFPLTQQIVHSTLLNCPSDLIALRFFLWCAQRPNFFHHRIAVDHMVGVIKRVMERYKTVKLVVKELECIGCVIKSQTFLLLLRIYWHGRMFDLVFEATEQMGAHGFSPNTFACNVLIDVSFKIGRRDLAIKFLKETQKPNFLTFNIAVCNLCNYYDLFHIGDVLRMMLRWGYYPKETFEMVLNCFCKKGNIVEAHQVLSLMITSGISVSVNVWSMLINGFCRVQRLDVAGNLLEQMVKTGSSPSLITYTTLIKGFLKSHMVGDALNISKIMVTKGYAPDLVLSNVLIDSLSKVGRYEDAIDVFVGMQSRKLAPDSCTLCSLLSAISLSGRFSLFPKLVHGLDLEADLLVCNSLLSYLCKSGFPSLAVKFYGDMLEKGFTPDKYTFVELLSGLCKDRRVDLAVDVYHGIVMNYPGQDAHIHTVLIDGLIKVNRFDAAFKIFRKAVAERYTLDVVAYTVIIHGLFLGRRTEEAVSLYRQMKEVGLAPNGYTYSIMVSGFIKDRDLNMVNVMLQEMIEAKVQLSRDTFLRLSKFLCRPYHSNSIIELSVKMRKLGLISAKVLHEVVEGVKGDDGLLALSAAYVKTSGFEELYDVAASMG